MTTDSTTARAAGTLRIVSTVASRAGSGTLGGALEGQNDPVGLAAQQGRIILAARLFLTAATEVFVTAFDFLPVGQTIAMLG